MSMHVGQTAVEAVVVPREVFRCRQDSCDGRLQDSTDHLGRLAVGQAFLSRRAFKHEAVVIETEQMQ
jgi:hypothetical protein